MQWVFLPGKGVVVDVLPQALSGWFVADDAICRSGDRWHRAHFSVYGVIGSRAKIE